MLELPLASGDIRLPDLLRSKVADVVTRHVSMTTYQINHLRRPESGQPPQVDASSACRMS
jgi:hypothetical protein